MLVFGKIATDFSALLLVWGDKVAADPVPQNRKTPFVKRVWIVVFTGWGLGFVEGVF